MQHTSRPQPRAGTIDAHREPGSSRPTRLVLHIGGPRHGHVALVPVEELETSLVYTGPRWVGVYRCVEPPRTHRTPFGPAQIWVVEE